MNEAAFDNFPTDPQVALSGTGPFRFNKYAPGDVLEYERSPVYFIGERPYLDARRMFIIPDGATRLAALLTGQIDLSLERLTPEESADLTKNGIQVPIGPLLRAPTVEFNTEDGPWQDAPVRRAASLAIDREEIRGALLGGRGGEGSYVPPWGPWAPQPVRYDPDLAKALLAEAGFPDGFKNTMTVPGLAGRPELASLVAFMWSQVGIETGVEVIDFSTWVDRLRGRDYSTTIAIFSWAVDDPDMVLRRLYASNGASNFTGFSSIDFDNILAAQATTADPDERHSKVASLQSILADLSPSAVIYWDVLRQGIRPDVRDYFLTQSLHARVNFANVWLDR